MTAARTPVHGSLCSQACSEIKATPALATSLVQRGTVDRIEAAGSITELRFGTAHICRSLSRDLIRHRDESIFVDIQP